MTDPAYFSVLGRGDGTASFSSTPSTAGPWGPELQHGGPPNALAVTEAERALHDATGRTDFVALRLSADFLGPVPVADLEVRTTVVRAARTAALVAVTIAGLGRDCLSARVWFVRDADTADLAGPLSPAAPIPPDPSGFRLSFGYAATLDWRLAHGSMDRPGPAAAWVTPTIPLLDGHEYSALARTVLIADSASGLGAELDWTQWTFANVDLDVHLARPLQGEWLLLDAATQLGPHGSALARSTLSDEYGPVGSGLQTLVVAPRSR